MLNFSYAFGSEISKEAARQGASAPAAVNAIWAVALLGGFLSNAGYSILRLVKNHTWSDYGNSSTRAHWFLALGMGVLWTGGVLIYGWGANALGDLGPAIGWPVYQGAMILTSILLGAATGEWRGAGAGFRRLNYVGLAFLILAIVILSFGNRT
jgi:L-rhamnose-H+ transport protein